MALWMHWAGDWAFAGTGDARCDGDARRAGDGSKARGTGDGVLVTRVISDSGNAVATPGEADDRR